MDVWSRLLEGNSLDGLGLSRRNGRVDLSGLQIPDPTAVGEMRTTAADLTQLAGVVSIKGATLQSLDFSGSRMNHLLFFDCTIDDCVFDNSMCQNWGLWGTTVKNTSFRSVDLRKSALGAVEAGKRNAFRQVDFTKADLRGTTYTAAEFVGCTFRDTRLDKVDFQTTVFADCTFEGELREVVFYRRGFNGEAFPPNEMTNVDFARAELRWVEFRGLDMETVRLPEDNGHLVVTDYPQTLDRLLEIARGQNDVASKRLAAVLANKRKWVGARQRRGVFNKSDLFEIVGEEKLRRVIEVIGAQGAQGATGTDTTIEENKDVNRF